MPAANTVALVIAGHNLSGHTKLVPMENTEASGNRELALKQAALDFGRRVKRLRKDVGLTQKELADRLSQWGRSYHQTTVAKLESGNRPTTLEELIPLSVALGVSQREFFQDPSPTESAERRVREAEQEVLNLRTEVRATHSRYLQLQEELQEAMDVYSRRMETLQELDPSTADKQVKVADNLGMVGGSRTSEPDAADDRRSETEAFRDLAETLKADQWPA